MLALGVTTMCGATMLANAASAGDWIADTSVGCRVWNPHPQARETIHWSGACANGYAHGRGAAQWFRDNLPFESDEGEWREGRQTGYGTQVWPTGRYEGELLDGEPHGTGTLTLLGVRYEGAFRNGKPNGAGTLTQGNNVYSGSWTNGCFRDSTKRAAFGVPPSSCP
jgi:hypothetical protein